MAEPSPPPQTEAALSAAKWPLVGVYLTILMGTLDMSIVNVSLPTLVESLQTSFAAVQWVVVSYVLTMTTMLLTVARLGDMHGTKKIFIAGQVVFTLASLACGLAPSAHLLIAFRAVQGLGASMTQALGVAIVAEAVPRAKFGRAVGLIGATVSIGLSAGPTVGGLLIGLAGWRSIFLVNLPLGLLAIACLARYRPPAAEHRGRQRFDLAGAGLLFLTLCAYCLGMTHGQLEGFGSGFTLGLLAAALVGLGAFIAVESRVRQPMIDLALFANPLFSLNLLMGFLVFVANAGAFIMPFYLQLAKGLSAQDVGLMMMTVPGSMGLIAPLAGHLSDRYGSRILSVVGLVLVIAGALAVSTLTAATPWWGFVLRAAPFGLGLGFFQPPNNAAIMAEAPGRHRGVASGLLNLSRTFGQTTGLPLAAALFAARAASLSHLPGRPEVTDLSAEVIAASLGHVYLVLSGVVCLATVLAVAALIVDRRRGALDRPGPLG